MQDDAQISYEELIKLGRSRQTASRTVNRGRDGQNSKNMAVIQPKREPESKAKFFHAASGGSRCDHCIELRGGRIRHAHGHHAACAKDVGHKAPVAGGQSSPGENLIDHRQA